DLAPFRRRDLPFVQWAPWAKRRPWSRPAVTPDPRPAPGWRSIPDPIDGRKVRQARARRLFPVESLVAGIAARASRSKNLAFLIEVVAAAQRQGEAVRLAMVVGGAASADESGSYTLAELEALCSKALAPGSFEIVWNQPALNYIAGFD